MPFPILWGLPSDCSQDQLRRLRSAIIACVAKDMEVPTSTVRPFFPEDRVGVPDQGQDTTVYCRIDTGMFGRNIFAELFATIFRSFGWKDPLHEKRKKVTKSVAEAIWTFLNGEYEVEVFVGDLIPIGKTHIKPR